MSRKGRRSSKDERIDAIRLLEQGYTKVQVARICNVTESSVYGWQKAYREGGLAALQKLNCQDFDDVGVARRVVVTGLAGGATAEV